MFKLFDRGPLRLPEGDGGGGGGSGDGDGGGNPGDAGGKGKEVDIDARVAAAVEEATAGLKRKNEQVIEERRKYKSQLDEVSGVLEGLGGQEGVQRLQRMHESLMKDELGKLLAEGKHDEWFAAKSKARESEFQRRLEAKDAELETVRASDAQTRALLKRKNLETEVYSACGANSVIESAKSDVMLNAAAVFDEHADYPGRLVILDEDEGVVFGKDGKSPKTITEWVEEQKESKRHWFPASKGADASGNLSGGDREVDIGEVRSVADWREKRKKLNMGSGFGTDNI